MSTFRPTFPSSFSFALVLLLPCFFLISACDSGGTSENPSAGGGEPGDGDDSSTSIAVSADEVAQSITFSLGNTIGGLSNEIFDAGLFFEIDGSLERSTGCDYTSETETFECFKSSNGSAGPANSWVLEREYLIQFFEFTPSGPIPVRDPSSADSMSLTVDDGVGGVDTDQLSVDYTMLFSEWGLSRTRSGDYRVTLPGGSSGRRITSTYSGREVSRFRNGDIFLNGTTDLIYRPPTNDTDAGLLLGSLQGIYDVTITTVNESGTINERRSVDVEFEATFTENGAEFSFTGESDFSGQSYSFNPSTGVLSTGSQ